MKKYNFPQKRLAKMLIEKINQLDARQSELMRYNREKSDLMPEMDWLPYLTAKSEFYGFAVDYFGLNDGKNDNWFELNKELNKIAGL